MGGNVELVAEGQTGQLVPAGNVEQFANALERYATSETLRREHGEAARRVAVQQFSLASMVRRYQAIYDEMCGLPT